MIGIKGSPDKTLVKMLIYCICVEQWEEERGMKVVPSPSDPIDPFKSDLRETAAKPDNNLKVDLAKKKKSIQYFKTDLSIIFLL